MSFKISKRKIKTVKTTLFYEGVNIDYQDVIECTIGNLISGLSIYTDGEDRAYFKPDCDYEIIVRPKK